MKNVFKTKRQRLLVGFIVLLITAIFILAGCGGGSGPAPGKMTYSGKVGDDTYTLEIIEHTQGRAAYTPKSGDTYVLTVGDKSNRGTVTDYNAGVFTLQPLGGEVPVFHATLASGGLTAFDGSVTWDGESVPETLPTTLEPITPPADPVDPVDPIDPVDPVDPGFTTEIDPALYGTWEYYTDRGATGYLLTLNFTSTDITWTGQEKIIMDTAFTGIDEYEHTWVVKDGTWSVRYYDVGTPGEVVTYDAYVYTITGNKLELARALAPDTVVETFIKQ